jgi:chromosome segregation ATPase
VAGKKPQALTLLSGGEQALMAHSLIFAVSRSRIRDHGRQ